MTFATQGGCELRLTRLAFVAASFGRDANQFGAGPRSGLLINRITTSEKAPPWPLGNRSLMGDLAVRGVLKDAAS
jgi:hypothetical protein